MNNLHIALVLTAISVSQPSSVIADDGDALYDKAKLLNVSIEVPADSWKSLGRQTRNMMDAFAEGSAAKPFTWFKAKVTINGEVFHEVAIRKKGFLGSLDNERPSLRMDLNKYKKNAEFDGFDNLTLNNCKQDRSLISQYLTYEIYRKAGLPAPRISLAKVMVNGKNLGIYANVEPVKKKFLRRNFSDPGGELYEGTVSDFYENTIPRLDLKQSKQKNPDRHQMFELAKLLDKTPLDTDALARIIDVDEFLKFWALESMIGFWDGYCANQNNFFVYRHPEDSRWHFIPWGADVSFARSAFGIMFKRGSPQCVNIRARIPHAMYNNPTMQAKYFKTMDELMGTVWDEDELLRETDRIEALLAKHVGDSQGDFKLALNASRMFIKGRRAEFAKERKNGPPKWAGKAGRPPSASQTGTASGTFSTVWSDSKPDKPAGEITLNVTVKGKKLEFEDLAVSILSVRTDGQPGMSGESPTLTITGKTKKGRRISLSLAISSGAMIPNEPLLCQGQFIEGIGGGFFNPAVTRATSGSITFEKASEEAGKPVIGKFKTRIFKFDFGN